MLLLGERFCLDPNQCEEPAKSIHTLRINMASPPLHHCLHIFSAYWTHYYNFSFSQPSSTQVNVLNIKSPL